MSLIMTTFLLYTKILKSRVRNRPFVFLVSENRESIVGRFDSIDRPTPLVGGFERQANVGRGELVRWGVVTKVKRAIFVHSVFLFNLVLITSYRTKSNKSSIDLYYNVDYNLSIIRKEFRMKKWIDFTPKSRGASLEPVKSSHTTKIVIQ